MVDLISEALGDVVADADLGRPVEYRHTGQEAWQAIRAVPLHPGPRVDAMGQAYVEALELEWLVMVEDLSTAPIKGDEIRNTTAMLWAAQAR